MASTESQRSVGQAATEFFQLPLPYEVYMQIFGYLTTRDLCSAMAVCRVWYDMATDGHLWYDRCRARWPIGIGLEAQLDHTQTTLATAPPPFVKDWYGLYKQRVVMTSPTKVMVVDFGSFSCKCAVINRVKSSIRTSTTESVVALGKGIFDHKKRREYERYFCGKEARDHFSHYIVNVVEKGIPVRSELLPEIITWFYYSCNVKPTDTPVVILEPPGLWDAKIRSQVAYTFVKMFLQSSVSFLSSAVATLCGVEHTSGVVVDVGHGVTTCVAVWEGEECPAPLSCDPLECTAAKVAELVHSVVTKCSEETQPILRERVVVTGGKAPNASSVEQELKNLDPSYSVIEPRSLIYSTVGGGCMLAYCTNFTARQEERQLKKEDTEPVRIKGFYQDMISTSWIQKLLQEKDKLKREMKREMQREWKRKLEQEWKHVWELIWKPEWEQEWESNSESNSEKSDDEQSRCMEVTGWADVEVAGHECPVVTRLLIHLEDEMHQVFDRCADIEIRAHDMDLRDDDRDIEATIF